MARKIPTRRELLDRWRGIEEEEDDVVWSDPSKQRLKEEWFADAFNFLICLPKDTHIWCGSWDLMGPLLETFYNYFKDKRDDSPLKLLWKRISQEMRQCTQCVCQHHQAQDMYTSEYESSSIGPLLKVLRSLDEERVTQHLKEINAKIAQGDDDSGLLDAEVVSVMFEVLMFPVLLDDQSLVNEFQIFIEAVDNSHELTFAGHQQYPGVYALLFLKSRQARSIGLRLAGYVGKLRRASDLEPLQPLLKKCIGYLETEVLPSTMETSRPRLQLERITVWLGIKALLGFLEPAAFEEGILERYPILLSIVLNHVSDDSLEFTYAVNCLRMLFEMLGCKLWLKTTLSPSVMRNTLLGQCFHTRNEKSHKEIFDLFQPFLQSLEALQDGEHEKQRRHFLYFLLHQVNMSSNFSILMRKKACQIALRIIHRGYTMNPPCPPSECAHMWGPSLICSLKDSSLHSSLRQPAFDLIHTILVSDAAALISSLLNSHSLSIDNGISAIFNDDEDEILFTHDVEEKDTSCWSDFSTQGRLASQECREWMCIPMLWFAVLVEVHPSVLPISFSKAVIWALSRLSLVEPENGMEMALSVRDWLPTFAEKVSASFGWEVPTGSDDGGDGKESKNSIKVSNWCLPLIKIFKRCAAHYVVQMEQGELWKQWTWEPSMAESLILLLLDPNDNVRQVDRLILEHVSKTQGLACGLQFLCSSGTSLFAIYVGLIHALKLVQMENVLSNFRYLHHFLFVLRKLLKDVTSSPEKKPANPVENSIISTFSSQGGFLRQSVFNASQVDILETSISVDLKSWENFSHLLSQSMWPSMKKCLVEGKGYINDKTSQMTCIRLLELLPIVFERMSLSLDKLSGTISARDAFDIKWLHDLIDWRKSSLTVIVRYWKQSVISVLHLLKVSCHGNSAKIIGSIETLISGDNGEIDELKEQVSRLSVYLPSDTSCGDAATTLKPKGPIFGGFSEKKISALAKVERSHLEDVDLEVLDSVPLAENRGRDKVIVLSDDEAENQISVGPTVSSHSKPSSCQMDDKTLAFAAEKNILQDDRRRKAVPAISNSKNILADLQLKDVAKNTGLTSQKHGSDAVRGKGPPASVSQSKCADDTKKETNKCVSDVFPSKAKHVPLHRSSSDETFSSKILGQSRTRGSGNKVLETRDIVLKDLIRDNNDDPWEKALKSARAMKTSGKKDIETRPTVTKKIILDDDNDPWEKAVKAASHPQSLLTKPSASIPKRQVIQLNMPVDNKSGYSRRMDAGVKRLKPPKLDDWFRPILEIDYFSAVGLSSGNEDESATMAKLKEVPVCFESPDHYVDIFRPLVLEEFKAQLRTSFTETSSLEEMCSDSISVVSLDRVDDFHLVRCVPGDGESIESRGCSENDLVLLTKQPLKNSAQDVHVVGKVERREKDTKRRSTILVIRLYLQNCSKRFNKAKRLLIERSKWYISRIMSITSQLREFQALSSLHDIPVLPIILKPTGHSHGSIESRKVELGKLSEPLRQVLKSSFNDSQLQAISVAIGNHDSRRDFELSLIQGPPGTGKTRTILAIVSGLLALPSERRTDASKNSNLMPSSSSGTNPRARISQSAAISRAWQDAAFARQLNEREENSKTMESFGRGRVLICAQSNAAVDELVSRISNDGLYGSDGKMYKPYLVRVGNPKTVHPCSLPFFIDTLVDQSLAEEKMKESDVKNDLNGDSSMALRASLEKLVDRISFYEAKRAKLRDGNFEPRSLSEDGDPKEDDDKEMSEAVVGAKLQNLYEQKRQICRDLGIAQSREKKASEEIRALKNKLRKSILREAKIVVTTLSGCGGDLYGVCSESLSNYKFGNSSEHTLFDAVVIDEAAQALEPATLIPLQLLKSNGTKCVMVGDPKQLPATVLSQVASKYLYECSMFERLQRAGHPVIMLTEQYRMHPEICQFPSLHFYDNKLLNGNKMASKVAPFHEDKYLQPYVFFDVTEGQECQGKNSGSLSLCNESEADAAVEVLHFFKKRYPTEFVGGRIGIISPYKSQVSLLRSRFSSAFGPSATADMEFNTVDGYQGREVDILILSTVRASDPSSAAGINTNGIGFVADVRRMNVALTRAKLSLWIFGNSITLRRNQNWGALVKNAEKRKLIVSIARPYWSLFKKPSSDSMRKPQLARSDSHPKHPKPNEIIREPTKCVDQIKSNLKEASESNTENVNNVSRRHKSKTRVDGKNDMPENGNVPSEVVAQRDSSRRLKDVRHSMTAEGVKYSQDKGKEIARTEVEKSRSEAKPSLVQQDTNSGNKTLNRMESEVSLPSTEGRNQEKEVNDEGRESNMVDTPKDLIAKRKRQRDAVDALLSSALIPSKKTETRPKSGPVKRPLSPTAAARGAAIRPLKPKKAPSTTIATSQDGVSSRIKMHQHQSPKDSSSSTMDLDEEWKSFKDLVQDPKGG